MCVFFYEIMFPFHARRIKRLGRMKYIAIVVIAIGIYTYKCNQGIIIIILYAGLITPLPGVLVALTMEEHHYNLGRFPPHVCVSSEEMWFYSTVLVITVATGAGAVMLILILRKIHLVSSN